MEELFNAIKENPETIKTLVELYKPVIYGIIDSLFGMYKDWTNNEEYFSTNAQFTWNRFKALKNWGFTDDQAMSIILNEDNKFLREISKSSASIAKSTEKISKNK